jgi:hypothetical protein
VCGSISQIVSSGVDINHPLYYLCSMYAHNGLRISRFAGCASIDYTKSPAGQAAL